MVTFDDNNRLVQITLSCDKEEYLQTIKTLADVIAEVSDSGYNDTYYLCNLIKDMLPDYRQLVNIGESEQLNMLKMQNSQTAETLINENV